MKKKLKVQNKFFNNLEKFHVQFPYQNVIVFVHSYTQKQTFVDACTHKLIVNVLDDEARLTLVVIIIWNIQNYHQNIEKITLILRTIIK